MSLPRHCIIQGQSLPMLFLSHRQSKIHQNLFIMFGKQGGQNMLTYHKNQLAGDVFNHWKKWHHLLTEFCKYYTSMLEMMNINS